MKKNRYGLSLDKHGAHAKILEMIGKNPGKILDVGCASGYLGPFYRKLGAQYLVGLEIDKKSAKRVRQYYDKVIVIDLNSPNIINRLPKSLKEFDVLVCADILEHLIDPLGVLKKLAHFLKPRGKVIVSLPNITFFMERWQILLGRFDYRDGGIMDNTHLRFFNRQRAIELVQKAGFQIVKTDHSRLGKLGWFPYLSNFLGVQIIIMGEVNNKVPRQRRGFFLSGAEKIINQ